MRIKKSQLKDLLLFLLLPIGILLFYMASFTSDTVERFYSNGVYKLIGQGLSLVTGLFPFSVAEFLVVSLVLYILWKLLRFIIYMVKAQNDRKKVYLLGLKKAVLFICVAYFLFVILWGLNYQRMPFYKIASYDPKPVTARELASVCEMLINQANDLRTKVQEDTQYGTMILSKGRKDAFQSAPIGYKEASKVYPELSGTYGKAKGIILSRVMSLEGIGGVYFPFTAEPNVNTEIIDAALPFTICHETAHQRGFAREDEANYLAYLTCTLNPNVDFQYSGYFFASIHAMNALWHEDQDKYQELRLKYGDGMIKDMKAERDFWRRFEGLISDFSSAVNNSYLKANGQGDGIKSYGRMVDLLIYEFCSKG